MVRRLACLPVFRITSSWPTSQRSNPRGTWKMHGPHHGQHGRGAREYPGGISQLTYQEVRLPFREELLATALPADVGRCLTLQSFWTLSHRAVGSDSPRQMWLLCSTQQRGRTSAWHPGRRPLSAGGQGLPACPPYLLSLGSEIHFC